MKDADEASKDPPPPGKGQWSDSNRPTTAAKRAVRNCVVERPKCLRPTSERGLVTVRAQRQQFGVRVGRLGPINVRSQGSKRLTDLRQRRTAPYIVFHHPGCLQGADMAINVKVTAQFCRSGWRSVTRRGGVSGTTLPCGHGCVRDPSGYALWANATSRLWLFTRPPVQASAAPKTTRTEPCCYWPL